LINLRLLAREFMTFAGVGVIATVIHYLVLVLMVSALGFPPTISAAIGYLAGAVTSYWINYKFTFRSTRRHLGAAARFAAVAATGLFLNTIIVKLGTEDIGLHYLVSQAIATVTVLFYNYIVNRLWTYREPTHAN
jgi:putative flippase GtrA